MILPLQNGFDGRPRKVPHIAAANAGLVWNKFFDRWSISRKDRKFGIHEDSDKRSEKFNWINTFCDVPGIGDGTALKRAADRIAKIARHSIAISLDHASTEHPRPFINTSRFVTGLGLTHPVENGFVWHHTLGVPYFPGSSVKGMIRAWADHWGMAHPDDAEKKKIVEHLFGTTDGMGALIVFDALPLKPVQLICEILTPHDGGWRLKGPLLDEKTGIILSPGDWHDPVPVPFLAVDKGQTFQFALGATRKAKEGDVEKGYALLTQALEFIGIGAKTASGFGLFEPKSPFDVGVRVRVSETVANKKFQGQSASIMARHQNGMWKVKLGAPGAVGGSEFYFAESDLMVINEP
jgi:CRISPR-associated protein Cmr6